MNADIKKIWVDALRSGEYAQGDGRLYDGESFCCLGVLCDIHSRMTKAGVWSHSTDYDGNSVVIYKADGAYNCGEVLPPPVRDWAELDASNPDVGNHPCGSKVYRTVAELNDYGYTFDDLANIIEERL